MERGGTGYRCRLRLLVSPLRTRSPKSRRTSSVLAADHLAGGGDLHFRKKGFDSVHAPVHSGLTEKPGAIGLGACIGFYDGFFGTGTGSFLMFLFVRFFGFDFLSASAAAKVVNVACNVAALMWFGYSGHLLWQLGLLMAVCQVTGSLLDTRLAIRHGSVFVRKLFLVVVSVLIF